MTLRIELPWPDSALLPNRRNGKAWQATQAAKVRAKRDAMFATRVALQAEPTEFVRHQAIGITIYFYPPDKRGRDIDGMLSSLKPALDAIAEVLGVNDRLFRPMHLYPFESVRGGSVVVVLNQLPF